MRPTQHPSNNAVLRPPAGATHEECIPLAITRVIYAQDNSHGVRSFWKPSPADLNALCHGAMLMLELQGQTHPPLWISVEGVAEAQA